MNPIDLGILILLLSGLMIGAARGLARLLLHALGFFGSVLAAYAYHDRLAAYLGSTWAITPRLTGFLASRLTHLLGVSGTQPVLPVPEQSRQLITLLKVPEPYVSFFTSYLGKLTATASAGTTGPITPDRILAAALAVIAVDGLAFFLIMAIVSLAFGWLEPLLAGAVRVVIGDTFNRLAGAGAGLIMAGASIALILGFAAPFLALLGGGEWGHAMTTSHLAGWFLQAFGAIGLWRMVPFPPLTR